MIANIVVIILQFLNPPSPQLKRQGVDVYEARNPLKKRVSIKIECGMPFKTVAIELGPESKESFQFTSPDPDVTSFCSIESWKEIK